MQKLNTDFKSPYPISYQRFSSTYAVSSTVFDLLRFISCRRNQFYKISSRLGQGFLCGEGVKMGLFPLPANTPLPLCIALPCMQVILSEAFNQCSP